MDTTMQQAESENTATTTIINDGNPDQAMNGDATETTPPVNKQENEPVPTYDQQFPSLGGGTVPAANAQTSKWINKPRLQTSIITQVFHIPPEERKALNVEGFGGSESLKKLDAIMSNTQTKIEMSSAKDNSLTFLLTGRPDGVLKAKRDVLVSFMTQATVTIAIPKDHHRHILGKGGVKLQDLEKNTATKINIPKTADNSDQVTIVGTKEGIEKACHEIRGISDEQSKQAMEKMNVPKIYHPFIQGPNNEYVNKMIANHPGVRVNIPPLSVMKDELSIVGEKEGVIAIKDQITKIWKEMERKCSHVCIEVKKSQHRYIIGPKGNAINEIFSETGVFVEMPLNESDSETITLRGAQEKLGLALTKVYEKANSVTNLTIDCPSWLHKYIIGKKGAGIQKISADCQLSKVHIGFEGDLIKIDGAPEEAEKAYKVLEQQANELKNATTFVELKVDAKYHKHIIGKGGSTINKIKSESDVTINIPDTDSGVTIIRIEGNKQGVNKAKEELEAMVEKMENEKEKDVIIENRFHRQIIGPKGENIQKIRDEYAFVQISFPDMGSKSDIVKLRGPKADVDKCAKSLNKIAQEMLASNYQEKIPIFKQFHKNIIGKGGANIKKIREETNTKIDLPDSEADSDMIIITGKKENVVLAAEKIREIQSQMANIVSKEMRIPAKIHNTVIGAGGKLIQFIVNECGGVSIKFPEAKSGSDIVTIRGPADDVEKAMTKLKELSDEKELSGNTAEVKAKPEHHKFLIGRQGINIQKIRNETGARIIFPGSEDTDRESIMIIGTKDSVEKAKKDLLQKIKELDNITEDTMTVDPQYHKHFVARRGQVLKNISDEFGGVIVSFPRPGVTGNVVNLKGAKNCVDAAKARISEIEQNLKEMVTIDCQIEQQYHRTVMGAKGSQVQRITRDFDVNIKFPDKATENGDAPPPPTDPERSSNPNIIRITGKKSNCEGAASALKELVPITAEVSIPFEFHRYIIGQKGKEVRDMMHEYDVNIRVPAADQESDIILISGVPAHVERAKIGLADKLVSLEAGKEDRLARSFEVTVEVKPEYHPKIIGRAGAVINKMREDYKVNIQLPSKGADNQEVITITGYEKDANEAKDAILKIVNQFESMIKEEVQIDPSVHSMIIGRRGRTIKKIMDDYKVDIRLPREHDEDASLVVVSGDEDNVIQCIEHLKNIEEEYVVDQADKEWMHQYEKPARDVDHKDSNKHPKEFKVSKAPWDVSSSEAFPSLSSGTGGGSSNAPAWGPKARR
jgi:polyribonucleotide nucleotidyltransferase